MRTVSGCSMAALAAIACSQIRSSRSMGFSSTVKRTGEPGTATATFPNESEGARGGPAEESGPPLSGGGEGLLAIGQRFGDSRCDHRADRLQARVVDGHRARDLLTFEIAVFDRWTHRGVYPQTRDIFMAVVRQCMSTGP